MRYEVRIDSNLAASFLKARDAVAFVAAVLRKQPRALFDIVDSDIGVPFDRASIFAVCKESLGAAGVPDHDHRQIKLVARPRNP